MIDDTDVTNIFAAGDFSEDVVFIVEKETTPASDVTLKAVFIDGTDETVMFGQVQIEAQKPSLIMATNAIGAIRTKMAVRVRGTLYRVERIEQSGAGLATLYLKT